VVFVFFIFLIVYPIIALIIAFFAIIFVYCWYDVQLHYYTCPYCRYTWRMRHPHNKNNPPARCPRCRRRL